MEQANQLQGNVKKNNQNELTYVSLIGNLRSKFYFNHFDNLSWAVLCVSLCKARGLQEGRHKKKKKEKHGLRLLSVRGDPMIPH